MVSLSVSGLSYSIGIKDILTDISFSVEEGDKVGVVGVNGSGKSTLLRFICGEAAPDKGSVYIAKDRTVGMLHQDDAFKTDGADGEKATVLESMYAAFPELMRDEARLAYLCDEMKAEKGPRLEALAGEYARTNERYIAAGGLEYRSRCQSILDKLGFGEESRELTVSSLSGGQRTRLALARLLSRQPDILILDEPTNHLDTDTLIWLEKILSSYKKTLIVVSHDRYFLDRVTNRTLDVENHKAHFYKCPYTEFVRRKEEARKAAEKKYQLQQKEIARLEAFIEQQRRWNREKNIIAAESREKAIARMDKVEKVESAPEAVRFSFGESGESGNDVLSVRSLSMSFGSSELFSNVSFQVKKREHVFIAGANGTGKSTLLKILLGKLKPSGGFFEFGYNVHIGYYDQENQNLSPEKTVLDELWDAYPDITRQELYGTLATFMFRGEDVEKKVGVLSGGERARLTLAKLMLSKVNLLILDEPTNHLDIPSREALETALTGYNGTLIAVSHDRYFMQRLSTRVIELQGRNGVRDWRGGYGEYAEKVLDQRPEQNCVQGANAAEKDNSSGKESYLQSKAQRAARQKSAARRKKIEEEISRLEAELADITDRLFGDAATDYVLAAELDDRRITVEDRLMQLYEEEESYSVAEPCQEP